MKFHMLRFAVLGTLSGVCAFVYAGEPQRTTRSERLSAEASVRRVLEAEMKGAVRNRTQKLKAVRKSAPDFVPLQWQSGNVRLGKEWIEFDRFASRAATEKSLREYRALRASLKPDIKGHLRLADWCAMNRMPERRRAHLTAVLEIDPNHRFARKELNYRRFGGDWISGEEFAERRKQARVALKELRKWLPKIQSIRHALLSGDASRSRNALRQLKGIKDSGAVAAIDLVLGWERPQLADVAVRVFGRLKHPESTRALARFAVFSEWKSIRTAAAKHLKDRKFEHFVPQALSATFTPVRTRRVLYASNRTLLYRHVFFQEGRQRNQLIIADLKQKPLVTLVRRPNWTVIGGVRRRNAAVSLPQSRFQQERATDLREITKRSRQAVDEHNSRVTEINDRVRGLLTAVSGRKFGTDPTELWDWWESYSETWRSGEKPTYVTKVEKEEYYEYEQPIPLPCSCLTAGTPVWTERGLVAIDKVQIGDMVLSKNIETGELAYKPVLKTTVRPAVPLMKLEIGTRTISLTKGHPFWISGHGWLKARDIKDGMLMHDVTGATEVRPAGKAAAAKTYNLIVADFHTYFVGENKVLSHDNTPIEPTAKLVPGLVQK